MKALFHVTHTCARTHMYMQTYACTHKSHQLPQPVVICRAAVVIEWVDVKQFTHTITINTKDTCASAIYPAHTVPSFGREARLIRLLCVCVWVCVFMYVWGRKAELRGRRQSSMRDTPVRDTHKRRQRHEHSDREQLTGKVITQYQYLVTWCWVWVGRNDKDDWRVSAALVWSVCEMWQYCYQSCHVVIEFDEFIVLYEQVDTS